MSAASPKTSPSALRSPLPPSITHSTRPASVSPRASRSCSSSVQSTAFSVEPSRRPSGTLPPSRVIPSTTITVCPATTTPSMNSATTSSPSRRRARCSCNRCRVRRTTVRLTALLLLPRVGRPLGRTSRLVSYWRIDTPASNCCIIRAVSGSRSRNAATDGNVASPPIVGRTRGRRTCTRRPPKVTPLPPCPSDDGCAAVDAGLWDQPAPRPPRETAHPARPARAHGPTRASAGAWSSSRRASAPPGAAAPGRRHSSLAFVALSLFSSSLAAPWPRLWGPFVLVDAILTPTREPSLISSQVQQGSGHLPRQLDDLREMAKELQKDYEANGRHLATLKSR